MSYLARILSFFLCACLLASSALAQVNTQVPTIEQSQVKDAPESPEAKPAKEPEGGPTAQWIWGSDDNRNYSFRAEFPGGSKTAVLTASCDNRMTVLVNGKSVTSSGDWQAPVRIDVQKFLNADKNEIVVQGANEGGQAGFVARLALTGPDGKTAFVVTDKSWQVQEQGQTNWAAATVIGPLGMAPWGNIFTGAVAAGGPRDVFNVLPGFQVEKLYTVPKGEQGSWVCITFDDKGRLIASDQGNQGLYRITPPAIGSEQPTKVEKLNVKISAAQGMLHAFGSLYLSVNGGPGSGFYRATDTNGDDQYDELLKLKDFRGGGEHGPHAVRLTPDGKNLIVICGNHTDPPENFDHSRNPKNWGEDLLLPRQWDARGHARGRLAPGGWIAQTDPEGKTWTIISSGYRNAYDMDYNADGELFAYDADMEWDMGSPWYRPTRVVHATSGSEFGWRSGTGKWPTYFVDSLPPLVDIGPGSPVGAEFGYGSKFPAKYQRALYILDWTFGTMYAIHIEPDGASYKAVKEEFVSRTPLPLTDAAVGPDGALYFTVGGRGTQSELFRVTYVGDASTAPVSGKDEKFADLRALRHKLEAYHHPAENAAAAVDFIYPHLSHADRFIRYAARIALENQPAELWQEKVLAEKNVLALTQGAVALARQGDKALQPKLLAALDAVDFAAQPEAQQLDLLRSWALVFIRQGEPSAEARQKLIAKLDPLFPSKSEDLNRELSRVLIYLNAPTVITKTLELMHTPSEANPEDIAELLARNPGYGNTIAAMLSNYPEVQKIQYALMLRNLRYGWTIEQRKSYFAWIDQASAKSGGASYRGFLDNIRKEALENASEAERAAVASTAPPAAIKADALPKPKGPGKEYTTDDLTKLLATGLRNRDFEQGKQAFAAARCVVCHRYDGAGGATGPDLSNVAGRFQHRDLSEAIVEPSKVISDQYRASTVLTTGGKVVTGRIANEDEKSVTVLTDPEDPNKVEVIAKKDIEELAPSQLSLMPKDLLNTLNEQEVLDLMAYLLSRGNPNDVMFGK